MKYFLYCLQHYADFNGRARRSEYWYFVLFNFIVSILIGLSLGVIAGLLNVPALVYLAYLWSLAVFIPSLAVSVRRLHDIGRSGWWLLLSLIPLVGAIILIIWHCTDSQPGANQYGPNPKEMDY
ncbi:DUF805 domain-containing protein [Alloprevotella sp. oral taxon 473]|jgi:hypothetical protein|uniref:DUF805 domain-containing protein n=1 Tax=Alloprevotella sp. oral taxon 473 TaxID=712469 RepID=UPI0002A41C5F|nr:DUF805 domain-containing protein [Alloprevotella sp. oral taxon 473]EKX87949.1 hypothetical protein HMPREF9999_02214 [Alloprevotella sp. oral taxon 473 str. F0040]